MVRLGSNQRTFLLTLANNDGRWYLRGGQRVTIAGMAPAVAERVFLSLEKIGLVASGNGFWLITDEGREQLRLHKRRDRRPTYRGSR